MFFIGPRRSQLSFWRGRREELNGESPRTWRRAPHILADAPESGPLSLVSALLKPGTYPPASSYVFLTERYVLKVKRPVDFGVPNYSTLAKRRYYCHREVRLNSLPASTLSAISPLSVP